MIPIQVTTKNILEITVTIAIAIITVIAGLIFLSMLLAHDPNSESFTILNTHSTPDWQPCAKKKLDSTVVARLQPIGPQDGYRGTAESVIHQTLFMYQYANFFGTETYHINYSLSLITNSDWTDFSLQPIINGGGNVGASAEITTRFNSESRALVVTIHQQFANLPDAKVVTLEFLWDGSKFALSNDS